MKKYDYKKLDENKVFFAEDPLLSKRYEDMLMKKLKNMNKFVKDLEKDYPIEYDEDEDKENQGEAQEQRL